MPLRSSRVTPALTRARVVSVCFFFFSQQQRFEVFQIVWLNFRGSYDTRTCFHLFGPCELHRLSKVKKKKINLDDLHYLERRTVVFAPLPSEPKDRFMLCTWLWCWSNR